MALWERPRPATEARRPDESGGFGRTLLGLSDRLRRMPRPWLLDLGPTTGGNIEYFLALGCRVQADDLISGVVARRRAAPAPPTATARTSRPLRKPTASAPSAVCTVDYDTGQFAAVLCWDLFDYLPPDEAIVYGRELRRITAEGGYVLGFFGPQAGAARRPGRRFRIVEGGVLRTEQLAGEDLTAHYLANRDVLRVFPEFDIAQTLLLKSGVREMLLQKRRSAPATIVA